MQETKSVVRHCVNQRDRRIIQEYPHGIRAVTLDIAGESWIRHVIVPRDWLLELVRRHRAAGRCLSDIEDWELLPPLFCPAGYDGPGRPFANHPWRLSKNRRWYVFVQTGGLDV